MPRMLSRVDLPDPDAPMMATNSPSATRRLTSRSTGMVRVPIWYDLLIPLSSIIPTGELAGWHESAPAATLLPVENLDGLVGVARIAVDIDHAPPVFVGELVGRDPDIGKTTRVLHGGAAPFPPLVVEFERGPAETGESRVAGAQLLANLLGLGAQGGALGHRIGTPVG